MKNTGQSSATSRTEHLTSTTRMRWTYYAFSLVSFCMFIYVFAFMEDSAIREQAIYWFLVSIAIATIPTVAPYVERMKFKDFEIVLRKEIDRLEMKFETTAERQMNRFFVALESVRSNESALPDDYKKERESVFRNFARHLDEIPQERSFLQRANFTMMHIDRFGITISHVKGVFRQLGYYNGNIDDQYSQEFCDSIMRFQEDNEIDPIDGIFGPITYKKLGEVLETRERQ